MHSPLSPLSSTLKFSTTSDFYKTIPRTPGAKIPSKLFCNFFKNRLFIDILERICPPLFLAEKSNDSLTKRNTNNMKINDFKLNLKRFTVPSLKILKTGRSLSPQNIIKEDIESAKLVRKYKTLRIEEQERELQLNHIILELQKEIEEKGEICSNEIAKILLKIIGLTIRFLLKFFKIKIILCTNSFK